MKVFFVVVASDESGSTNVYDFDIDDMSIFDQDSGITLERSAPESSNLIISIKR